MNREFDHVNDALASSLAGRTVIGLDGVVRAAWRSSRIGDWYRTERGSLRSMPKAIVIRSVAIAVAIAAAMQPALISAMPATVAPAVPWFAFALIVLFAAFTAWQAESIVTAWPGSAMARWLAR